MTGCSTITDEGISDAALSSLPSSSCTNQHDDDVNVDKQGWMTTNTRTQAQDDDDDGNDKEGDDDGS